MDDKLFPKPNPNNTNPFVRWANKLLSGCVASTVRDSSDVKVRRTKEGTFLTIDSKFDRQSRWSYDAEYFYKKKTRTPQELSTGPDDHNYFDPTAPYQIGDIVRVNKIWYAGVDPVKNTEFNPELEEDTHIYIYPGIYICVQTVPGFTPVNIVNSQPNINRIQKDLYRQTFPNAYDNIIYAPLYPEPYRLASKNIFTPNTPACEDYRSYQGRYWELISLYPTETKVCVNGKTVTALINGAVPPADPSEVTPLPSVEV